MSLGFEKTLLVRFGFKKPHYFMLGPKTGILLHSLSDLNSQTLRKRIKQNTFLLLCITKIIQGS